MDKKRVLIIKSGENDFEKFYNNEIIKSGYDLILHNDFRNAIPNKRIHNFKEYIKSMIKKPMILKKKYDLIIVFEDILSVKILEKHIKDNTKIILWNWNIKNDRQAKQENRLKKFCEIWTFDKNNAEKYGWNLNVQFYFENKLDEEYSSFLNKSVFCICLDKGRYRIMKELHRKLIDLGVKCDFMCIMDKQSCNYDGEDKAWLSNEYVSYYDIMHKVKEATCIVDIVQEGQEGITIRALEALFYNKKLITNNSSIKYYELYNENNIYILNENNKYSLKEFLKINNEIISEDIKRKYTFENWMNNFKRS